jgi:hypothetical protein
MHKHVTPHAVQRKGSANGGASGSFTLRAELASRQLRRHIESPCRRRASWRGVVEVRRAARSNPLVKALPLSSKRPGVVSERHHSQTLPHRSYTPYGLVLL